MPLAAKDMPGPQPTDWKAFFERPSRPMTAMEQVDFATRPAEGVAPYRPPAVDAAFEQEVQGMLESPGQRLYQRLRRPLTMFGADKAGRPVRELLGKLTGDIIWSSDESASNEAWRRMQIEDQEAARAGGWAEGTNVAETYGRVLNFIGKIAITETGLTALGLLGKAGKATQAGEWLVKKILGQTLKPGMAGRMVAQALKAAPGSAALWGTYEAGEALEQGQGPIGIAKAGAKGMATGVGFAAASGVAAGLAPPVMKALDELYETNRLRYHRLMGQTLQKMGDNESALFHLRVSKGANYAEALAKTRADVAKRQAVQPGYEIVLSHRDFRPGFAAIPAGEPSLNIVPKQPELPLAQTMPEIPAALPGAIAAAVAQPVQIPATKQTIKKTIAEAIRPSAPEVGAADEYSLLKLRFANQSRGAMKGYQQGVRDAKERWLAILQTKKEGIGEVRDQLLDYIKQSDLTNHDKGKLLTMVSGTQTLPQLTKALDRVDRLEDTHFHQLAVDDLKDTIKSLDLPHMLPEYKTRIEPLLDKLTLKTHRESTLDSLRNTQQWLDNNPDAELPDYMMDKLAELDKTPIKDLSTEELGTLSDLLQSIKGQHDLKLKFLAAGEIRQGEKDAKALLDNINYGFGKKPPAGKAVIPAEGEIPERIEEKALGPVGMFLGYSGKMPETYFQLLDQNFVNTIEEFIEGKPIGVAQEIGWRGLTAGQREKYRVIQNAENNLREMLTNARIAPDKIKHYSDSFVGRKKAPRYSADSGGYWGLSVKLPPMTRAEMIELYAHAVANPNRLMKPWAFKFNEQIIYPALAPEDLQSIIAQARRTNILLLGNMGMKIMGDLFPAINGVHLEQYHFPLAQASPYYPMRISRKGLTPIPSGPSYFKALMKQTLADMSIIQPRVEHNQPLLVGDFFDTVRTNIDKAAMLIGFAKPLRRAEMLFNNPDVRKKIELKYGTHWTRGGGVLPSYFARLEPYAQGWDYFGQLVSGTKGRIYKGFTPLNYFMAAKQPLGLLLLQSEGVPIRLIAQEFARPRGVFPQIDTVTQQEMLRMPTFRARYEQTGAARLGPMPQIGETARFWLGTQSSLGKWTNVVSDVDNYQSRVMIRILKNVLGIPLDRLANEQEFPKLQDAAETLLYRLQSATDPLSRTSFASEKGGFQQALSMWQSSTIQIYNSLYRQAKRMGQDPSFKRKLAFIETVALGALLTSYLNTKINDLANFVRRGGQKPETPRSWRQELLRPVADVLGNFYGGNGARAIILGIANKNTNDSISVDPISGLLNDAVKSAILIALAIEQRGTGEKYERTGKGFRKGELKWKKTGWRAITSLARTAPLFGLPVIGVGLFVQGASNWYRGPTPEPVGQAGEGRERTRERSRERSRTE